MTRARRPHLGPQPGAPLCTRTQNVARASSSTTTNAETAGNAGRRGSGSALAAPGPASTRAMIRAQGVSAPARRTPAPAGLKIEQCRRQNPCRAGLQRQGFSGKLETIHGPSSHRAPQPSTGNAVAGDKAQGSPARNRRTGHLTEAGQPSRSRAEIGPEVPASCWRARPVRSGPAPQGSGPKAAPQPQPASPLVEETGPTKRQAQERRPSAAR